MASQDPSSEYGVFDLNPEREWEVRSIISRGDMADIDGLLTIIRNRNSGWWRKSYIKDALNHGHTEMAKRIFEDASSEEYINLRDLFEDAVDRRNLVFAQLIWDRCPNKPHGLNRFKVSDFVAMGGNTAPLIFMRTRRLNLD